MRKQYHFRTIDHDVHIWDVDRLVAATKGLAVVRVPIASIAELDEAYWFEGSTAPPTCRQHARLIQEADLTYPIILAADGRVMDGMHRVGKALLRGEVDIAAVRFEVTPAPDFMNRDPSDLPY